MGGLDSMEYLQRLRRCKQRRWKKIDRTLNKKEEIIFKGLQKSVDDVDVFIEKRLKKLM